ncbi:MAG TPA: hypothetical protein VIO16_10975, partial [Dehalococcoidia bacterium]
SLEHGDVEFENVQARVRTLRLMTKANRYGGPVIGTGDLSEKALGWSTYAGDHIAMYDLNAGIPKTLVNFVIRWVATDQVEHWTAGDPDMLRKALFDVLDAPISPELLPPGAEGEIAQLSESTIGPYELQDFFLYWFVRHGTRPRRLLRLAEHAFEGAYSPEELRKWLIGLLPALLQQPVEAGLHRGRTQGRHRRAVAAWRLAHAERRDRHRLDR